MFALNFYTELYGDALRKGRKTATVRLGDKSSKYQTGQLVWITLGQRYSRRIKVCTAIIDDVDVKRIVDLSPRDLMRENPELRDADALVELLVRIYDRPVGPTDVVTVIHFSPVEEYGFESPIL
ncbi:MAG: hypothetical protein RJB05_268 [Armatimonadota bacterium]